jgi:receptor protein-tyrosine kinase
MFGRKRAHLVERAVERLAQSGELDASSAHLMDPDQQAGQAFPHVQSTTALGGAVFDGALPPAVSDLHDTSPHDNTSPRKASLHDNTSAPNTGAQATGAVALADWESAPDADALAARVTPIADQAADADARPFGTADGDGLTDGGLAEAGPHTLMPGQEGAGQPFVDMTSLFRAGMIDWNRVRSRVSEEFRLVQRQIVRTAFTAAGAEPGFSNLLMITSSIPGEGKSFTALNLAACIARQRDHHVLLIDIDSKRDSFCMALGLGDAPGLLDLAANPELEATQVMARTAIENLSVLPIGIERDLGPELFASKQMTKLIQAIGRRYADRLIVLDAPPTLSTSDPAALAPIVGQVLFVVEAERTQREEVVSSLDLLQACPTITLLLNKVQVQTRYTFGAYSTYYTS